MCLEGYRGREIINDEEVVVMMQIIKNGEVLITRQVVNNGDIV